MSASSAACTGVGPNRELGAAVSRAVINNHRKRGKLGGRREIRLDGDTETELTRSKQFQNQTNSFKF